MDDTPTLKSFPALKPPTRDEITVGVFDPSQGFTFRTAAQMPDTRLLPLASLADVAVLQQVQVVLLAAPLAVESIMLVSAARRAAPAAAIIAVTPILDETLALDLVEAGAHDVISEAQLSAAALHFIVRVAQKRLRWLGELSNEAQKDELTGLLNRRSFSRAVAASMRTAAREENGSVSLIYIDLDGLKEVNDTRGHQEGDRILKLAATKMESLIRGTDLVGRLGGDEFAVLLDGCTKLDAQRVAANLVAVLGQPADNRPWPVSASIGLAAYPEDGDSVESLLGAADQAMYVAKREGGNQWRVANPTRVRAPRRQRTVLNSVSPFREPKDPAPVTTDRDTIANLA